MRGGSNATGCVRVELLYEFECDDDPASAGLQTRTDSTAAAAAVPAGDGGGGGTGGGAGGGAAAAALDCSNMCVYSALQRRVGLNGTSEAQRDAFVTFYLPGSEVACYHPVGKLRDGLTFTKPRNPTNVSPKP